MNDSAPSTEDLDRADMEALRGGDDLGLNALMDRHGEPLFHYLIRLLQDESDAADLAQETFVRVYQNRHRFDAQKKFTTWLYSIATNLARNRWRYRARHPAVSLDAQHLESEQSLAATLSSDQALPSEEIERAEKAKMVREAIAALPEELRTPLVLAEYEEMAQAEIARVLGCSVKAVENRVYRARQRLCSALTGLFSVPVI